MFEHIHGVHVKITHNMKHILFALTLVLFGVPYITQAAVTDLVWVKSIPYTNSLPIIENDSAGNVYVTAQLNGSIDLDLGPGTTTVSSSGGFGDVFVAKYTNAGDLIWAKAVGGGASDESPTEIVVDASGNVYVLMNFVGNSAVDIDPTGSTVTVTPPGGGDVVLVKLNSSGVIQWGKIFGTPAGNLGFGLGLTTDGVVLSGFTQGAMDLDPGTGTTTSSHFGSYDTFTVKLNTAGEYVWGNLIGGTGDDRPIKIAIDQSDNVYLLGYFHNSVDFDPGVGTTTVAAQGSSQDIFLLKLQSNGQFAWVKTWGGDNTEEGKDLLVDSASNVYFSMSTTSGTLDLNPGEGTDTRSLAGSYVGGVLVKLDTTGSFLWGNLWSAENGTVQFDQIAIDAQNDVYISGSSETTFDANPGVGVDLFTPTASYDGFIIRVDSTGEYIWYAQISGPDSQSFDDIFIDGTYIYTSGTISGVTDFDPTSGTYSVTPSVIGHFLLKLTLDTQAPSLTEVTPIGTTTDTTPDYVLTTDEVGTLTYSGYCSSSVGTTTLGTNTITLTQLAPGVYGNCVITVRDASYNVNTLSITSFTISSGGAPQSSSGSFSSGGGGATPKGCTDVKAKNYQRFVEHVESLCVYDKVATTTVPFTRNLRIGSKGADVMALQELLIKKNIGPAALTLKVYGATGTYGVLTRNAVREFQLSQNITPAHGLVGPQTRVALSTLR
ncbi:MAG: hypothetical protein FGM57_02130 [Candidatus Taylorbacteria bacterium]|nr:hypothetical protein [Candidatus Taylorbacteria bacterium]